VLAVKVDYETKLATVGTEPGQPVPKAELLAALQSIGYSGEIVEKPAGE
jgi:hypothetical protein